tara:strand:+ start:1527 stop:1751 length:225 start_codon:yes stop_codon:yes gene_type:complete
VIAIHGYKYLGLQPEYMFDVIALVGIVLSLGIIFYPSKLACHLSFAILWYLYFTIVRIGQVMRNQNRREKMIKK